MTEAEDNRSRLTEVCWPVFEFVANFTRQAQNGTTPPPDQVRYEALAAWRDAEDIARGDPVTDRAWEERIRGIMVYLIDYKLLNTDWPGRDYWFDHRFETDVDVLDQVEPLGGDKFFEECDELQKEYEQAERRGRRDSGDLAEQLSIFFICLRLGFRGRLHDEPQKLADYTRRLFTRLPASATTRTGEMFADTYEHNQEMKVDYRLGLSLTVVIIGLLFLVGVTLVAFRWAWSDAIDDFEKAADKAGAGMVVTLSVGH